MLLMWCLHVLFETIFKVEQAVFCVTNLENDTDFTDEDILLITKLSHGIDNVNINKYRMRTKPTKQLIRCLVHLAAFMVLIYCFKSFWIPIFQFRHDHDIMTNGCAQTTAAIFFCSYIYALLNMNVYVNKHWTMILHHLFTVIYSVIVMHGIYIPTAIIYGFMITFDFIIFGIEAFRYQYHTKYPELTRTLCKFLYYYYFVMLVTNITVQSWFHIYGICTGQLKWYHLLYGFFAICVWMYTDIIVLKILKEWRFQKYERLDWVKIFGPKYNDYTVSLV